MSSFIELCQRGERLPEEIDDYVDAWHEDSRGRTLHEFLGMKKAEYNLWVIDPDALSFIIDAHRTGEDAGRLIERFRALPLAARADSAGKALHLAQWLKAQGLWQ